MARLYFKIGDTYYETEATDPPDERGASRKFQLPDGAAEVAKDEFDKANKGNNGNGNGNNGKAVIARVVR